MYVTTIAFRIYVCMLIHLISRVVMKKIWVLFESNNPDLYDLNVSVNSVIFILVYNISLLVA